jgi:hypothetical protein
MSRGYREPLLPGEDYVSDEERVTLKGANKGYRPTSTREPRKSLEALIAEDATHLGEPLQTWRETYSADVLTLSLAGAEPASPGDRGDRLAAYERRCSDPTGVWNLRVGPEGAPTSLPKDAAEKGLAGIALRGSLSAARETGRKVELVTRERCTAVFQGGARQVIYQRRANPHAWWRRQA